jgi:hypothetical protein
MFYQCEYASDRDVVEGCISDKAHKILHTSEKMDTINPTIEFLLVK